MRQAAGGRGPLRRSQTLLAPSEQAKRSRNGSAAPQHLGSFTCETKTITGGGWGLVNGKRTAPGWGGHSKAFEKDILAEDTGSEGNRMQ